MAETVITKAEELKQSSIDRHLSAAVVCRPAERTVTV